MHVLYILIVIGVYAVLVAHILIHLRKHKKEPSEPPVEEKQKPGLDLEMFAKKHYMELESAYLHQRIVIRRSTAEDRLTLGEILQQLFPQMDESSLLTMAVAYRSGASYQGATKELIIDDASDRWHFDVFAPFVEDKTSDKQLFPMLRCPEATLILKTKEQQIIISLNGVGRSGDEYYMIRATILIPDCSMSDDCRSFRTKSNNVPFADSLILSYGEVKDEPEFNICRFSEEYKKIEASVNEKVQRHAGIDEYSELELAYIHAAQEFDPPYYVNHGKWLFEREAHRYYDAYTTLERAFYYLQPRLNEGDEKMKYLFYDISKKIGICLSVLGREDEASYYFRQTDEEGLMLDQVHQMLAHHRNKAEHVTSSQCDDRLTIGSALSVLLGLEKKNLAPCMFIYDTTDGSFLPQIEDQDTIVDYTLNDERAKDKVFVLSCSHAHYLTGDEEDKSILCTNAPIIISTHAIQGENSSSIMRVDVVRCNFGYDDDKRREDMPSNIPLTYSLTVGSKSGVTFSTDKESLSKGLSEAMRLIHEMRFMEALKLSKGVFDYARNQQEEGVIDKLEDESLREIAYDASYCIGYCLMELEKATMASYYLEIAAHALNYKYVQEYINCLSNTMDMRALPFIENVIRNSPKPTSPDDLKAWEFHMAFLKRRKAYVLIDLGRIAEARAYLTEMLDDPMNKDFAGNELKYIDGRFKGL